MDEQHQRTGCATCSDIRAALQCHYIRNGYMLSAAPSVSQGAALLLLIAALASAATCFTDSGPAPASAAAWRHQRSLCPPAGVRPLGPCLGRSMVLGGGGSVAGGGEEGAQGGFRWPGGASRWPRGGLEGIQKVRAGGQWWAVGDGRFLQRLEVPAV